jgi:sugar phosphate isomerase/epimerase
VVLEPLNRYESTWFNRLDEGVELLRTLETRGIRLLADLFHMNIEEANIAGALRDAAEYIGHVHLADSNRRAIGWGHLDGAAVGRTLREIGYRGYLTAEIFPRPDTDAAARQTVSGYRKYIEPK